MVYKYGLYFTVGYQRDRMRGSEREEIVCVPNINRCQQLCPTHQLEIYKFLSSLNTTIQD